MQKYASETDTTILSCPAYDEYNFVPFTLESHQRLVERELLLKTLESKRNKYAQEAHLVDGELRFGSLEDESILPPENPDLKEGNLLFTKSFSRFPPELLGVPIEELDPGIREKTFVVICSRYRKKYINRFTASKSLFIFTPWNPVRRATLCIATHQLFDVFIFFTIIFNCVFLAMPTMPIAEKMEYLFLSIYTTECIIKIIGRGFILNSHTYLRDPWNWLDFIVIVTAFITLFVQAVAADMSVRDVRGLRAFRVLRALKTVSIVPGLKTIVSALLRAFKMLFEVILLTLFCLMIFAMFGLQAYRGVLRQKCVVNVTGYVDNPSETFNDYYIQWIRNPDHWYQDEDNQYVVCGNNTGAGLCPTGYTCIPDVGDNPRYGFLNFDHFGWAALTSFQLVALDFWEDVYNKVMRAKGPWSVLFFIIIVFFGSFYLINLMLAVVSTSYEEEAVRAGKEREREKKESARKKHNALYDVSYYHLKAKESNQSKKIVNPTAEMISRDSDTNRNAKEVMATDLSSEDTADNFHASQFKKVSLTSSNNTGEASTAVMSSDMITIIKADALLDPEIGVLDHQVIDRNCDCCETWVCCYYVNFLRVQNYFYAFVSDPLFDFMITIFIVINTFFMSLEHHGQPDLLTTTLAVSNAVFTTLFFLEACCKILGLGKYYFVVGWNIFDLLTVIASVLDLFLQEIDGLNVLRTFRLLRVLKLAQSWPTMRMLVTVILSTLGALGNLCVILCIVLYIFAVIGLQLFRESYTENNFGGDGIPRWNFTDFYHSMLMIFRVLCGEWIEPLYQCMRASQEMCIAIFLPALVFGNFIVLNLFLALLLNAFASDSLDKNRDTSEERSKLTEGWQRLKQILFCCCIRYQASYKLKEDTNSDNVSTYSNVQYTRGISKTVSMIFGKKIHRQSNSVRDFDSKHMRQSQCHEIQMLKKNVKKTKDKNSNSGNKRVGKNQLQAFHSSRHRNQLHRYKSALENYNNSARMQTIAKSSEHLSVHHVKYSSEENEDDTKYSESVGPPADCLPQWMSSRMNWLNYFSTNNTWMHMRIKGKRIVDHPSFECIIMLVIIGSSITLAFEDIYLYQKPELERAILVCNIIFAIIFIFEMLVKWIGLGFTEYFTNFWTILDFSIVLISILSLIGDAVGASNIAAFRSLRTLRAFRPLRAVSRWQGMKIVVNALMNAIPAIINVFLVCMVFWLIFSIMGVQFYKGRFYKCINQTAGETFDHHIVPDRTACQFVNGSWQNMNINFDSAANGFLALFQVATFEGWMEIISAAVDNNGVDNQPKYEASPLAYLYFVVFIVIGSFFSLNLFIGVIIDNFNVLKKKYEGSYLDAFLTQNQRNYYNTLKKMVTRKPKKTVKRPQNKFQLFFYDVAVSSRFEMGIVLVIFLNLVATAMCHYNEPASMSEVIEMINIIFTCIFTLEAILKIIGLRIYYFRFPWNVFDFFIVIVSLLVLMRSILRTFQLGALLDDSLSGITVMPTLLRTVRVFHIGRVLRLIKSAKGIRKLLFAIIVSLPAVFNIGALLFLIIFIYAILGMSSFGAVKLSGAFDELVNFQTFGNSFLLLLRLSTAAGWNDILEALLIKEPYCNPHYYTMPDGLIKSSTHGNCGNPYLAIPFMVSYIMFVFLIVINMYIAVLLENFSQAHVQEEVGITEDDFDMFYTVWEKYDPFASQFIKYEQLGDFIDSLEPPLQISKPNEIALVSFNIPILEGDKMHCVDILIALMKNVLSDVEESDEMEILKHQMEAKFSYIFPSRFNITVKSTTLQRKKQDVAARTLQRSWRSYKARKAMRDITAHAQEQKLMRGSVFEHLIPTFTINELCNKLEMAMDKFFDVNYDDWDIKAPPQTPDYEMYEES